MDQVRQTSEVYSRMLATINRDFPINGTDRVVGAEKYLTNIILNYDDRNKDLKSKHVRGACGEIMYEVIADYYRNYFTNFKMFKNLVLPLKNGGTTQLDFVMVSPRSVLVIEVKSLFGNIFIEEETVRTEWKQHNGEIGGMEMKPWNQNLMHIIALKDYLDIPNIYMHNVIFIFGAGQIQQVKLKNDYHLMTMGNAMSLLEHLMEDEKEGRLIPKKDMKKVIQKLTRAIPTIEEEIAHVQYLKKKFKG